MTNDVKYSLLMRVAELIASRSERNAMLAHHKRVSSTIMGMLTSRKFGPRKRTDGVTKDNPTGNPFKKLRGAVPTAVSSKFDQSLNSLRAARDVPDSSFD